MTRDDVSRMTERTDGTVIMEPAERIHSWAQALGLTWSEGFAKDVARVVLNGPRGPGDKVGQDLALARYYLSEPGPDVVEARAAIERACKAHWSADSASPGPCEHRFPLHGDHRCRKCGKEPEGIVKELGELYDADDAARGASDETSHAHTAECYGNYNAPTERTCGQ